MQQQSSQSGTTNLLTAGGETFSRSNSSGTWLSLADALGSTLSLTDTTGALRTDYTYDPFGNSASTGESVDNPNQYAGTENDGILAMMTSQGEPKINDRRSTKNGVRTGLHAECLGRAKASLRPPIGILKLNCEGYNIHD